MTPTPEMKATDYLVDVVHPGALDATLTLLPGCVARVVGMPEPKVVDGHYVVRVFGNPDFFLFAMGQQGYCKVVRALESLV